MIHMIWSGWARKTKQLYASLHHTDAVRSRMKAEWGQIVQPSCFIQTEKKLSGSYLVVSTHTSGPVHLKGGGGTSSMWHIRLLVWLSVHGFACWSAPEAILFSQSFHLFLDPVYRVSPADHTKRSASSWYWWLYFSLVLGKQLPVKTGICWSSGGSAYIHTHTYTRKPTCMHQSVPHCPLRYICITVSELSILSQLFLFCNRKIWHI